VRWNQPTIKWLLLFIGLGGVAFGSVRLGKSFVQSKRATQMHLTARDAITEQLRGIVSNRAVLQMSTRLPDHYPGNDELRACMEEEGICRITDPEKQIRFVLKNSIDSEGKVLAGSAEEPGIYGINGKLACDRTADEGCPGWVSYIWFWADCPDLADECQQAERLWVRFQVQPAAAFSALPAHPPLEIFSRYARGFAYSVPLSMPR
jgi:hypothetical protein